MLNLATHGHFRPLSAIVSGVQSARASSGNRNLVDVSSPQVANRRPFANSLRTKEAMDESGPPKRRRAERRQQHRRDEAKPRTRHRAAMAGAAGCMSRIILGCRCSKAKLSYFSTEMHLRTIVDSSTTRRRSRAFSSHSDNLLSVSGMSSKKSSCRSGVALTMCSALRGGSSTAYSPVWKWSYPGAGKLSRAAILRRKCTEFWSRGSSIVFWECGVRIAPRRRRSSSRGGKPRHGARSLSRM
jgi:hypothetical protein